MRRNADSRLRALERKLENGDEADVLAYLAELERNGVTTSSDLRPGLQKKILEIMKDRAARTASREDITAYMKALQVFAPGSDGDMVHAAAIALLEREVDPVGIWMFMREPQDARDEFMGPALDDMERHCEELRLTSAPPVPPALLRDRRQIAADIAAGSFDFGDENAVGEWDGWQTFSNSDVWHRVVYLQPLDDDGNPIGDTYSQTLEIQFAPRTATITNTWLSD